MYSYCIMARKTRRRTQKRSRRSRRRGKSARKKRRSRQRGGSKCSASESQPAAIELAPAVGGGEEEPVAPAQDGGRRRRRKTAKKGKKGKRKMNAFFKIMLKSKRAGAASFQYKGKTYKGRKHHRLGMVYRKA